jgi:TniQ
MRKISKTRLIEYSEFLNEEVTEPSPHSRLYGLVPMHANTPLVESATGYTIRLAATHCMLTKDLLWREIMPLLGRDWLLEWGRGSRFLSRDGRSLNGVRESARGWVEALEKLTLRTHLQGTTMLPWADVFSQRGLLRPYRAWCPKCYAEWREAGSIVYEPLIWAIDLVKVCPVHNVYLSHICQYEDCQKCLPVISKTSYPGHCSYCGRWLGNALPATATLVSKHTVMWVNTSERPKLKWYSWASRAVGELIAIGQTSGERGSLTRILAGLTSYLERVESGELEGTSLGRRQTRTVLYNSQKRGQMPSLATLLGLCFLLRIEPTPLLAQGNVVQSTEDVEITKRQRHNRGKRRRFDSNNVRRYLEAVLESDEQPRPCMREVASQIGYQTAQIARHFPQLCAAISALYLAEQSAKRKQRMEILKSTVREATLAVYAEGMKLTTARVGAKLEQPGLLRSPELQAVLRATRAELGLD